MHRYPSRFLLRVSVCYATLVLTAVHAAGQVQFDVSPHVACIDVTTSEFTEMHPGEKLVEARIQVSSLRTPGTADELDGLLVQFTDPEQTMLVHDYSPKTQMVTDVAGSIKVERSGTQDEKVTLGVGGSFENMVHADMQAIVGESQHNTLRYEMTPPRELLAAAGTLGRSSGVYFKLRSSTQQSLEGAQQFVLILRVPQSWRGGYLRAFCQARTKSSRGQSNAGRSLSFLVPLYALGDAEAHEAALELLRAERQLMATAQSMQGAVKRRSQPTWFYELSLVSPKIPSNWLSQVVHRSATQDETPLGFERHLPEDVRVAVDLYRGARRDAVRLSR